MKITYLGHSGFLAETEKRLYLFDYYKGEIPALAPDKMLYVFVSHRHEDHFNPAIFELAKEHPNVCYVLAFDIRLTEKNKARFGISQGEGSPKLRILSAHSRASYELEENLSVETYRSTDEGVAFLVREGSRTIFHAGDLNWWFWEGEDKGWLGTMEANFKKEVARMAGIAMDVAFLPLDDRLEKNFYRGMDWYLRNCQVRYAFPMHFWKDDSVIERFERLEGRKDYETIVCDTAKETAWELPV